MDVKKPAFFLDVQICTGCKTCMVACMDKNDLGPGIRWRRVVEYSGGQWRSLPDNTFAQDVFGYYISLSCNHCDAPICVEVCPTGAMNQDENGIVTVDETRCMGCRYCEWACPYGAPQYNPEKGKMSKCNFCRDDLETSGEPSCVAACPTRALTFGERDKENSQPMAPLPDDSLTSPGLCLRPHKKAQPVYSRTGAIANPEEYKNA